MTTGEPLLVVHELRVNYGRLAVLKGISIKVRPGELVCMIGPNGAGKSTALAAIAGGVPLHSGSVHFGDVDLTGKLAETIARLGLSLVPEGRHVFGTLTVEENLRMGFYGRNGRGDVAGEFNEMFAAFPRLRERRRAPASSLSGGEQQMLVIARALLTRPRLLMVDEPSLGLAPKIIDQVYDILLDLRTREGLTLLINEQSSQRLLKHADRVYVIREGLIQLEDSAANLRQGDAIKRAYFGFGTQEAPKPEGTG
jgi:branched-chain amino acid transport system ATP-binding protein